MDTNNLENRMKRHVLCEMNNTTAPISSRYRAREKHVGNSQEEKITLYADEHSEIDKENLESHKSREVLLSEPPYIANVKAQVSDQKLEKEVKNPEQVSHSIIKVKSLLGSDSKPDSLIPIRKEVVTSKKTDKNAGNCVDEPLYIPPKKLGEKFSPPVGNKISRPPNAFMIFAKEHRPKIKEKNPCETNRQVSIILGNLWRNLSGEEKAKYFLAATESEKQHKEKYPDYIYCPTEARKQKQTRLLKRQKTFQPSENSDESSADKNECPKIPKKTIKQEVKPEVPTKKLEKNEKGISTPATYKEMYNFSNLCFSPSPMDSPIYWPYASEWMSPFHNPTGPYCNCQDQKCDASTRPSNSGYQQHLSRQLGACSQSNKCGNSPYPYPHMFHPAVMNPWLMFSNPFCGFNGSPEVRDMHNAYIDYYQKFSFPQPNFEKNGMQKSASSKDKECATKDPLKVVKDPRKVKEAKYSPKVEKIIVSTKIKEEIDSQNNQNAIGSIKLKQETDSSSLKKAKDSPNVKETEILEHETDSDSHHSLIIADENLELEDILMDVKKRVKGKRGLEE